MDSEQGNVTSNSRAARLLAVEVLLGDPEALADDVLEACLYILRDRLLGVGTEGDAEAARGG
jgi:hypothetical protein